MTSMRATNLLSAAGYRCRSERCTRERIVGKLELYDEGIGSVLFFNQSSSNSYRRELISPAAVVAHYHRATRTRYRLGFRRPRSHRSFFVHFCEFWGARTCVKEGPLLKGDEVAFL